MHALKALINLQEIKKPSGKILRVWAKNQREFNFLNLYKKISKEIYPSLIQFSKKLSFSRAGPENFRKFS